jgi:hypothetical protein
MVSIVIPSMRTIDAERCFNSIPFEDEQDAEYLEAFAY